MRLEIPVHGVVEAPHGFGLRVTIVPCAEGVQNSRTNLKGDHRGNNDRNWVETLPYIDFG